jgi:uncharacterized membrane protein YfcA
VHAPIIVVAVAAFGIGFSKAGVGGGLGPLLTVLMLAAFPPATAVSLLLPLLMVGDLFSIAALWRRWSVRHTLALLPGASAGVAAGTYLISTVPPRGFRVALGVVVLGFVAYFLVRPRLPTGSAYRRRGWHGWLAGTAAGFTSALVHSGGPPVAIYLLLQGLEPVRFVATTVGVFTAVNLIKVPAYASVGLFDWELQLRFWWAALLVPVGVVTGRWMLGRLDPDVFGRVVTALLAVAGLFLILSA